MNKQSPAISVILPVYNAKDYLEESLNSVLKQTLKNIEIICVDDGSTDASLNILHRFQKIDPRIHILTQENQGAGPARNVGLNIAQGEYIAFLDPDDYYPSDDCLQKLYELAIEYNAKIAGGSLLYFTDGEISKAVAKETDFTFDETKVIQYKDFQQAYYYQRFIYLKDMLEKANIRFPNYRRFQDVVFLVKAMIEANEFVAMETPSYVYRKSKKFSSLTDIQINDMLRGYIDVLTIAKDNEFFKLFIFLSNRISKKSVISDMVKKSIEEGNKTAEILYSNILEICDNHYIQREHTQSNDEENEETNNSSFFVRLKSIFTRLMK